MVQLVDPAQQRALDHDAKDPDHQRRQQQHPPVPNTQVGHGHPGNERPHHEQRTVRKVDHVEQPEDDREAQA